MQDYIIRAVAKNEPVRITAVTTTGVVEEAHRRHKTSPVAAAALGRTLTAALMLATEIKGKDILTVRVMGDGPLGAIVASAGGNGTVRGYVQNPEFDLPPNEKGKLPVGAAVGQGTLHVSKDLGLKYPFVGSCELISGEISEDITYYLYKSEQIPSAVSLGVLVGPDGHIRSAGGVMVQIMGDVDEVTEKRIVKRFENMEAVSSLVDRGHKPEDLVKELDFDFEILANYPVAFQCQCTKERVEKALVSIGVEEIEDIMAKEGQAEASCHFCGDNYIFGKAELGKLLVEMKNN
ncbi:MAG: Hsp33 family molecular chaperone HslO [Firmicutes bacterium]|nr:Hsp33 family molecular chaperone HslO [Bacillota bacterium]